MSTKTELTGLVGEDEARRLLETVDWLDESLKLKGVAYKAQTGLDELLEGLSEAELEDLYVQVGKLLKKRDTTAIDTEGKKSRKILLTYEPGKAEKSVEAEFHPSANVILAQSGSESVDLINRHNKAQKNLAPKSAMDRSCAEGIERIMRERGLSVRTTKGRPGRFGGPNFEMTQENIEGIAEIMAWRKAHGG